MSQTIEAAQQASKEQIMVRAGEPETSEVFQGDADEGTRGGTEGV